MMVATDVAAVATRNRPGQSAISVKLSALHPRYEAISRKRVLKELTPRLVALARSAGARIVTGQDMHAGQVEAILSFFTHTRDRASLNKGER